MDGCVKKQRSLDILGRYFVRLRGGERERAFLYFAAGRVRCHLNSPIAPYHAFTHHACLFFVCLFVSNSKGTHRNKDKDDRTWEKQGAPKNTIGRQQQRYEGNWEAVFVGHAHKQSSQPIMHVHWLVAAKCLRVVIACSPAEIVVSFKRSLVK